MSVRKIVAVNERGLRLGEDHGNAKLTNAEVELLLTMRDEGWSYRALAEKFEISKSGARKICLGQTRCQTPVCYKAVYVPKCGLGET